MKTSRLKNTVIVILALTNACLLILLISRKAQERGAHERVVSELVQLYAANGVELPNALVPLGEIHLSSVDPARSIETEAAFAEAILGSCTVEDVGGGIYRYVSGSGQCLLRSSGLIEATLDRYTDDPETFSEGLFSSYGYAALSSDLTNGTGTVTAVRMLQNAMVFNAELTLTFSQNHLCAVSGSLVPTFEPVTGFGSDVDGVTALVRYLDYTKAGGEVCTVVTDVRSGYLLQSTTSASQRLIPAWCITTDVNEYYVNMLTGEVTREG